LLAGIEQRERESGLRRRVGGVFGEHLAEKRDRFIGLAGGAFHFAEVEAGGDRFAVDFKRPGISGGRVVQLKIETRRDAEDLIPDRVAGSELDRFAGEPDRFGAVFDADEKFGQVEDLLRVRARYLLDQFRDVEGRAALVAREKTERKTQHDPSEELVGNRRRRLLDGELEKSDGSGRLAGRQLLLGELGARAHDETQNARFFGRLGKVFEKKPERRDPFRGVGSRFRFFEFLGFGAGLPGDGFDRRAARVSFWFLGINGKRKNK
jgi:hypothetical protein